MTENDIAQPAPVDSVSGRTPESVISSRTRTVAGLMLLAIAIGATLDYLAYTGPLADYAQLILAGLTLVPLVVAALILGVARGFGGAVKKQWMTLGAGMLSVGVGNVIFVALYAITGSDPYPSVADVFTLTGYALFAAGLTMAVRAYRGIMDIRRPLAIGAVVGIIAFALVYFTVIGPYVVHAPAGTQSLPTRILNTIYPTLDTLVLLAPAVALGLIVSRLGAGRVAWPWWFVVSSATALALTDAVFAYATYHGYGRTPIIDTGYALAPMLLGFAVFVARDIYDS